ncbi:hydroxyethylthiazole kinase [Streptomyces sp. NBC_00059]|uniref:hydroxyethylthiazole kinase n=1 Tax=Streptomyces sp. NBC_00059 TaxID=2975635 RepID=UPI00225C3050|nr:hydroxyethylthiazole kinase [Streptomyces sp. NBC_00059]MCX5415648.1 hydroxyethylthiazole kinase [Streptomyces sp. NBC_00059]
MPPTSADHPSFAPRSLARVRADSPLVQCLTNTVVTGFTANVLLALGASPAMVDIPEEAGPFAGIASGVLVNLGTPHAEQRIAMAEAAHAAASAGTPWVLDPVAVGALPVRTALARELLELRPTVIRGNASEIVALAGAGGGGRGVDASDSVEAAEDSARELARTAGSVVAVSGPVDFVTDGARDARIANGDALLTRVTGGGCALGAVMAAFAAVEEDPFAAVVTAATAYTVAAELAARTESGPGGFAVAFLDALDALDEADLTARAALS